MKKKQTSILDTIPSKFTEKDFIPEMTEAQLRYLKSSIAKHFLMKTVNTRNGKFIVYDYETFDKKVGLAYTSTSSYAGLWVCSNEVYSNQLPGYHYIGFTLTKDLVPVAVLHDKDENCIHLDIAKKRYV